MFSSEPFLSGCPLLQEYSSKNLHKNDGGSFGTRMGEISIVPYLDDILVFANTKDLLWKDLKRIENHM